MKKWSVLAVAILLVAGVQAKEEGKDTDSGTSLGAFIAIEKQKAEASGVAFDKAKAKVAFVASDKNGDGVLTSNEMTAAEKQYKKVDKEKKAHTGKNK